MATTDYAATLRQFVCGLQGHDSLLEFGRGRLSLKCVSCGHETPGWDIKPGAASAASAITAAQTEAPRRRLLPHFAGARRLA